jgi:hypothetical protein
MDIEQPIEPARALAYPRASKEEPKDLATAKRLPLGGK